MSENFMTYPRNGLRMRVIWKARRVVDDCGFVPPGGDFVSSGVRRDYEQQRGYEIRLLDSSSRFEQHRNCVRGMHTDFHFRREYSSEIAHSAIAGEIVIPRRAGDPTPR